MPNDRMMKVLKVAAFIAVLVLSGLGPASWQPRSGLGFEIDHSVGYFAFTVMFCCFVWPRPLMVGGALTVAAILLEWLQNFTPDRSPALMGAVYSAAGVLTAALLVEVFNRVRSWLNLRSAEVGPSGKPLPTYIVAPSAEYAPVRAHGPGEFKVDQSILEMRISRMVPRLVLPGGAPVLATGLGGEPPHE